MRERVTGGGNILAGTSSGMAGAEQGRCSKQNEKSEGDREILAHDDGPSECVGVVSRYPAEHQRQMGRPRLMSLWLVSAPPTAPMPPPINAPVSGLPPVTAPIAAPVPAPIKPPDAARSPVL